MRPCWRNTVGRADPAQQVGYRIHKHSRRFGAQTCDTDAPHCGAWATHTHTVLVDPQGDKVSADSLQEQVLTSPQV